MAYGPLVRQRDCGGELGGGDLLFASTSSGADAASHVVVEECRCGCTAPQARADPGGPEWPLAIAWAWLTAQPPAAPGRPASDGPDDAGPEPQSGSEPERDLPWWDSRARPGRRRAVLPLVLLGELQAGVLLRAVYEVAKGKTGASL